MADFLRVSEVLEAFPNPAGVTVKTIRERFGVCFKVASIARALAIDLVTVQHLQKTLGISQSEAEELYAMNRPPITGNGRQAGSEIHVHIRGHRHG